MCKAYAVDGYKACVKTVPYEGDNGSINIPIFSLPKSSNSSVVTISDDERDITFNFQSLNEKRIYRKTEGEFFDVSKAFPTGEPVFSISFDSKILLKALESYKEEEIIDIDFYGELNACKITGTDSKSIVLPMSKYESEVKK